MRPVNGVIRRNESLRPGESDWTDARGEPSIPGHSTQQKGSAGKKSCICAPAQNKAEEAGHGTALRTEASSGARQGRGAAWRGRGV